MKKITLLTMALTACVFSFAQIGKGSLMLGGSLSFGESNSKQNQSGFETKANSFGIAPSIGYAVRQNLFVGVGGSFFSFKNRSVDNPNVQQESKNSGWSGSIFLRKYAGLGKGFYLFAEPALYYSKSTEKASSGSAFPFQRSGKTSGIGISLYPGVAYAVNGKLHLEIGLNRLVDIGYSKREELSTQSGGQTIVNHTSNGFSISANTTPASALAIGARIVLAK